MLTKMQIEMIDLHQLDLKDYIKEIYSYESKLWECLKIDSPYKKKIQKEINKTLHQRELANNILMLYKELLKTNENY